MFYVGGLAPRATRTNRSGATGGQRQRWTSEDDAEPHQRNKRARRPSLPGYGATNLRGLSENKLQGGPREDEAGTHQRLKERWSLATSGDGEPTSGLSGRPTIQRVTSEKTTLDPSWEDKKAVFINTLTQVFFFVTTSQSQPQGEAEKISTRSRCPSEWRSSYQGRTGGRRTNLRGYQEAQLPTMDLVKDDAGPSRERIIKRATANQPQGRSEANYNEWTRGQRRWTPQRISRAVESLATRANGEPTLMGLSVRANYNEWNSEKTTLDPSGGIE
ncbi:unnamed protein product [Trichogramma brassicae]|uniref:Uncharacterized protein n=1 Tax=Trichogramma brassicae TaxID=86971 RepID=A0A6H5I2N3_9HYME|nr:unnamed protein product [Trichogramma brassicae]